jgi:hypothetical protein
MDFQCPAALFGSEVKSERENGWIKVRVTNSAMHFFPTELGNEVVMHDVNKFHGLCAQSAPHSKGALQAPQREHRVVSPQIDASKAEDCSADSTADSLSQDEISLPSGASEVEFAGDSASSSAVFHGMEDRHLSVDTFCTGLVTQRVSTFTKFSCSKSRSSASLVAAPGRGLTTECIRDGCVSQRVSMFTKLSSSTSRSFSSLTDVPDQGLVSERIRAHERFINGAALGGEGKRPLRR